MKQRKLSEIYREAAKLIEDEKEWYSCLAIDAAQGLRSRKDHSKAAYEYADAFGADLMKSYGGSTARVALQYGFIACGENRNDVRVIALCFMAAICESEGK